MSMSDMIMDYCTKLKTSQIDFLKSDELQFPPHSLDLNPVMSEECFKPRIESMPLKLKVVQPGWSSPYLIK